MTRGGIADRQRIVVSFAGEDASPVEPERRLPRLLLLDAEPGGELVDRRRRGDLGASARAMTSARSAGSSRSQMSRMVRGSVMAR